MQFMGSFLSFFFIEGKLFQRNEDHRFSERDPVVEEKRSQ